MDNIWTKHHSDKYGSKQENDSDQTRENKEDTNKNEKRAESKGIAFNQIIRNWCTSPEMFELTSKPDRNDKVINNHDKKMLKKFRIKKCYVSVEKLPSDSKKIKKNKRKAGH